MHRILIIGSTGSGKSTLAKHLAECLHLPHIELDALFWEPDWTPATDDAFRERVFAAISQEAWIVDGNYMSKMGDELFQQADTAIWLDFPLYINFWRLLKRTTGRVIWRNELWNGNRERMANLIDPRDNLFVWLFKTYRTKRRKYLAMMTRPDLAHVTWVHIRSKHDYEALLTGQLLSPA